MSEIKVNILYEFNDQPWGGGNQFLKTLKKDFQKTGSYTNSIKGADIVLFNSHHIKPELISAKKSYPSKIFVHRVDGPIRLYNDLSDIRDSIVYNSNNELANATIFQSDWSMKKNIEMGMLDNKPKAVILNGSDLEIFKPKKQKKENVKTRIISTSFSPNMKKGFAVYQMLDENLDFNKFEYVFAGANPVKFKNINHFGVLDSARLSEELRLSDIFITASENDPCSNSLIEALNSELTCFALNSGGHTEILNNKDMLFDSPDQLLSMVNNYNKSIKSKFNRSSRKAADEYMSFFHDLLNQTT
tara:strand:- start:206 stop:1111 length:906 start_codon:yes stop_codon:yes gene_type:complete